MKKEPTLVVMAAGIGSRYGGLKQIDKMTEAGEIILDFSLYDAMLAGFRDVIFVIRRENEKDFHALFDCRAGKYMQVRYCYQDVEDMPEGYTVPRGRKKAWGTAHAAAAARHLVQGPFAVINADDFYGREAFQKLYAFLREAEDGDTYRYAMVAFLIENTLSPNGVVSRGLCRVSESGQLEAIREVIGIGQQRNQGTLQTTIVYSDPASGEAKTIAPGTLVSMNCWAFTTSMMREIEEGFPAFLDSCLKEDPIKGEYYLPSVVDRLLHDGKADVQVLHSRDRWYGVTYQEDRETVREALQALKDKGTYPALLWD